LGSFRIKFELRKKGVPADLIEKTFDEYSPELEKEIITRVIEQRLNTGDSREKIIRYLKGKGFGFDIFLSLLNDFPQSPK